MRNLAFFFDDEQDDEIARLNALLEQATWLRESAPGDADESMDRMAVELTSQAR